MEGVDLSQHTLDNRNLYLNSNTIGVMGDGVHPLDYTVEPMVGIAVDLLCVFSHGSIKSSKFFAKTTCWMDAIHSIPKNVFQGRKKHRTNK